MVNKINNKNARLLKENICKSLNKKEMMTLKPEEFKILKSVLGKDLKDKCDFCGCEITEKNYGYLSFDIVSCKGLLCIRKALEEDGQI